MTNTVEPLINNALNKGHLYNKGYFPMFSPLREDNQQNPSAHYLEVQLYMKVLILRTLVGEVITS